MERSVRGDVECVAGAEGEDIVGLPPLQLPLPYGWGRPGVGPRQAVVARR